MKQAIKDESANLHGFVTIGHVNVIPAKKKFAQDLARTAKIMLTNFWLRSCPCLLKINHPAGMMATILPESRRWASKDHVKYTAPLAVSKKLLFSDRYGLLALRNRAVTTLCTVRCRLNTEWNYNPFRIDFTNPNQVVNYY